MGMSQTQIRLELIKCCAKQRFRKSKAVRNDQDCFQLHWHKSRGRKQDQQSAARVSASKLNDHSASPIHFSNLQVSEGMVLENIVQLQLLQSVSPLTDVTSEALQLPPICHLLVLQVMQPF